MARSGRDWSRRDFGQVVAVGAVGSLGLGPGVGRAAGTNFDPAASPLAEFVRSLDAERRARLVLRADDPRRGMVQNRWAIVPEPIAALSARQQELALGLFRQVLTEEGFGRWSRQREDDAGGWKHDHLAIFAAPDGSGAVEWVVTGRHLTLRGSADGSVRGGPLFAGHTASGPTGHGHAPMCAAERLFAMLGPVERRAALVTAESARSPGSGLAVADLDAAGQGAARRLIATLAEPFRRFAVPAVRAALDGPGPLAAIRWQAFGPDDVPPVAWRLVGPGFRWSVHAEPHFHAWFESA